MDFIDDKLSKQGLIYAFIAEKDLKLDYLDHLNVSLQIKEIIVICVLKYEHFCLTQECVFEDANFLTENAQLQSLSHVLYNEFIKSILKIIEKLDLTLQKLDVSEQVRPEDLPIHSCCCRGAIIMSLVLISLCLYSTF